MSKLKEFQAPIPAATTVHNRFRGKRSRALLLGVACCLANVVAATAAHAAPPITAARVSGIYTMGRHVVGIRALGKGKLLVQLDLSTAYLLPSGEETASRGFGRAPAQLNQDLAVYLDKQYPNCGLTLRFLPLDRVQVSQAGSASDCGFGSHTDASGTYRKNKTGVPMFENLESDTPEWVLSSGTVASGNVKEHVQLLTDAIRSDGDDLAAINSTVTQARTGIETIVAVRKDLEPATKAEATDFKSHVQNGSTGHHKYLLAIQKGAPKPLDLEELQHANEQYRAAKRVGDDLSANTGKLRSATDDLARRTVLATEGSSAAAVSVRNAKANIALLKTALQHLAKDPDAKTSASAARQLEELRNTETSITSAATAITATAREVTQLANLSTANYEKQRGTRMAADAQQRLDVKFSDRALTEVERLLKSPGQAPQCNIRKIDWGNFDHDGIKLKNGRTAKGADEGFSLAGSAYADTDNNRNEEAFVQLNADSGGTLASDLYSQFTYVYELDTNCVVKYLGQVSGAGTVTNQGLVIVAPYAREGEPLAMMTGVMTTTVKVVRGKAQIVDQIQK